MINNIIRQHKPIRAPLLYCYQTQHLDKSMDIMNYSLYKLTETCLHQVENCYYNTYITLHFHTKGGKSKRSRCPVFVK